MLDSIDLPKVEKVKSSVPLSDLEAFDMMSRFLEGEKAKAIDLDFAGQSYLASSSQIWNDLRFACNSLLVDDDHRREPVAVWKDEMMTPSPSKSDSEFVSTEKSTDSTDKEARRSAKKEKKEAKKAKKEAKKIKKEVKKAKKEVKKAKKEAKKRKPEDVIL